MRSILGSLAMSALLVGPASFARADEPITLTCFHPSATTAVFIRTRGDEVLADFVHRKGTQAIPLQDEAATAERLPTLAARAEIVKTLGEHWKFRWRRSDCKKDASGRILCTYGKQSQTINGLEVKAFSLWTTHVTETSLDTRYDATKVKLYLLTNARTNIESARDPVLEFSFLKPDADHCQPQEDVDAMSALNVVDEP